MEGNGIYIYMESINVDIDRKKKIHVNLFSNDKFVSFSSLDWLLLRLFVFVCVFFVLS